MRTPTPRLARSVAAVLAALALAACSDDAEDTEPFTPDTSYLDDIHGDDPQPKREPEADPEPEPDTPPEPDAADSDEDRPALTKREGSKSTLGRSRDRGRDTRNRLSGGTSGDVADTQDRTVRVRDLRWETPDDWEIAVPSGAGVIAELLVPARTGNASITFTAATGTPAQLVRTWEAQVLDYLGEPSNADTSTRTIDGCTVTLATLNGIYTDNANGHTEHPAWTVRGAIIQRPGESELIVIKWYGPELTVQAHAASWDALLRSMRRD